MTIGNFEDGQLHGWAKTRTHNHIIDYYYDKGVLKRGRNIPFTDCKYEGDLILKDGSALCSGKGKLTCSDGEEIEGLFEKNLLTKADCWKKPNGDIYRGGVKE